LSRLLSVVLTSDVLLQVGLALRALSGDLALAAGLKTEVTRRIGIVHVFNVTV
jgi:hypothetical protein